MSGLAKQLSGQGQLKVFAKGGRVSAPPAKFPKKDAAACKCGGKAKK